jgi:L-histidine N-alpha-methyltransferase
VPEPILHHLRPAADEQAALAAEVRAGLEARPMRRIPCACFYDEAGSALFDEITRLPEYYLTRTEDRILSAVVPSLVAALQPRELFELGSGTGTKIRRFLDAMRRAGTLERCVLIDVSASTLEASARRLGADYPGLAVTGLVGDFTRDLALVPQGAGRLGLFLGSTIGNLPHAAQPAFLRALRATLEPDQSFLVGYDLVKDPRALHAAYNDARGVTAEFNRNVLRVLNARLGADFDPAAFEHVAFYDAERAWIEMRLRSRRAQRVQVHGLGLTLDLGAGEEIQMEASLRGTGLALERWLTDADGWFAVAQLGARA